MRVSIWKETLDLVHGSRQELVMNEGRVLSVQTQEGRPVLWYEAIEGNQETRTFFFLYTGDHVNQLMHRYCGTLQHDGLVWHVYEVTK